MAATCIYIHLLHYSHQTEAAFPLSHSSNHHSQEIRSIQMEFSNHHFIVPISIITALAITIRETASQTLLNGNNVAETPTPQGAGYFVAKPPRRAGSPKSAIGSQKSAVINQFVDGHNRARASVGVPPVSWNESVAAYAEAYAAQRAGDCEMEHSEGPYGENIAEGYGELKASDAVNMWVGERPYYDHASNSCTGGEECGHYTQVVWRDTTSIGCAREVCRNGWMFVTCNYYPPGNYIGERPY
ncbi:unnamed protein product [Cuscuta epithymum]|uniref:SCP domain-containing protein n=1 Tax=Cuscuta epithymum TaxID=186058 RepID=A0AAV0C8W3_9ASTE|nr:unnamed protein product [Cuscuta epithymum]